MKPGGAVVSRTAGSSAVAFSWEHEPGVSKQQSPVEANKPAPSRGAETIIISKQQTPPADSAEAKTAHHPHRLRVPPPPGGPGAPAVSPPRRSRPRRRSRGGVCACAGDDPFLAAFLACTERGRGSRGQKLLGWAGLRLGMGYGLGLRGFGLSCKSSCQAVEQSVVRLPRIHPPKFTRNDA